MNAIDFSELPHKKHSGKRVVDWRRVDNDKIKEVFFTYVNICYTKGYLYVIIILEKKEIKKVLKNT